MAGYAMAPGAFSAATLALVTSGTLLTSSAANAINQWMEVPYDCQMARTAARPLVRGHLRYAALASEGDALRGRGAGVDEGIRTVNGASEWLVGRVWDSVKMM